MNYVPRYSFVLLVQRSNVFVKSADAGLVWWSHGDCGPNLIVLCKPADIGCQLILITIYLHYKEDRRDDEAG
jgi:hypothetical protein